MYSQAPGWCNDLGSHWLSSRQQYTTTQLWKAVNHLDNQLFNNARLQFVEWRMYTAVSQVKPVDISTQMHILELTSGISTRQEQENYCVMSQVNHPQRQAHHYQLPHFMVQCQSTNKTFPCSFLWLHSTQDKMYRTLWRLTSKHKLNRHYITCTGRLCSTLGNTKVGDTLTQLLWQPSPHAQETGAFH